MTPDHRPAADGGLGTADALDAATADLRAGSDVRWVEVSERVRAEALGATRRSHPVRAQAPTGPVHVSEQVLIAHLRTALDEHTQGSTLDEVRVHVLGRDRYAGVTIALIADYGQPLLPVADRVRAVARQELGTLLGDVDAEVSVETMHVHFCDVVRADPHS